MGITKLIQIATILAIMAVSSGKLPQILNTVRKAQIILIQDSKASNWGGMLLHQDKKNKISELNGITQN